MSEKVLMPIVGGLHDGRRVMVDRMAGPTVCLPADHLTNYVQPNDLTAIRQSYTEPVAYKVRDLRWGDGTIYFLAPVEHGPETFLRRLIDGYMVIVPEGQGKTIHTSKREAMGEK